MSIGIVRSVSSVFFSFLAVIFWRGAQDSGVMLREEDGYADNDNLEASEKGCETPKGPHDRSCYLHLSLWCLARVLVGFSAQPGSPVNL
jgi:hypothetical protein